MAIPMGTTARQLRKTAGVLPGGVIVLGVLTWWWPGYRSWGAMSAGLILSLILWVSWRIVAGRRTVAGHPFYWALLIPAAMGLYHLLWLSWDSSATTAGLGGAMTVTLLFQLALLVAGVMLVQSAFASDTRSGFITGPLFPSVFSLSVCLGASAAAVWAPVVLPRDAMALLACAGALGTIGALSPLTDSNSGTDSRAATAVLVACGALLVSVCLLAAKVSSVSLYITAAMLAGCMLLSLLRGSRSRKIPVVAAVAVGVVLVVSVFVQASGAEDPAAMLLGRGEAALLEADLADAGLAVLDASLGRPALILLLTVSGASGVWLLMSRPASNIARVRAACWTSACGLSLVAMLSAGGLFIPAVTAALALFWGLLPAMCGTANVPRSGAWLLAVLVGLMIVLGASASSGLLGWSVSALGGSDHTMHAVSGFLLALVLAWLMGARNVWLGVAGIVLAAFAGVAGELLQSFVPGRGASLESWLAVLGGNAGRDAWASVAAQLDDIVLHAVGAVAVLVFYLPAMGARWCESPDAPPATGSKLGRIEEAFVDDS